jgi:hypothetical protein
MTAARETTSKWDGSSAVADEEHASSYLQCYFALRAGSTDSCFQHLLESALRKPS